MTRARDSDCGLTSTTRQAHQLWCRPVQSNTLDSVTLLVHAFTPFLSGVVGTLKSASLRFLCSEADTRRDRQDAHRILSTLSYSRHPPALVVSIATSRTESTRGSLAQDAGPSIYAFVGVSIPPHAVLRALVAFCTQR